MDKFIMATIRLPIEFKNGVVEPIKEHIQINFEVCYELPPKQETDINYSFLMNNLTAVFNAEPVSEPEQEPEPEPESFPTEVVGELPAVINSVDGSRNILDDSVNDFIKDLNLYVHQNEIIKNKRSNQNNSSFKNKRRHANRFTAKNH